MELSHCTNLFFDTKESRNYTWKNMLWHEYLSAFDFGNALRMVNDTTQTSNSDTIGHHYISKSVLWLNCIIYHVEFQLSRFTVVVNLKEVGRKSSFTSTNHHDNMKIIFLRFKWSFGQIIYLDSMSFTDISSHRRYNRVESKMCGMNNLSLLLMIKKRTVTTSQLSQELSHRSEERFISRSIKPM